MTNDEKHFSEKLIKAVNDNTKAITDGRETQQYTNSMLTAIVVILIALLLLAPFLH